MKKFLLIFLVFAFTEAYSQPPEGIAPSEADALCASFWEGYDFRDLTPLQSPKVILDYIYLLSHLDHGTASAHVSELMRQASGDKKVFRQFLFLFERYLYDSRSRFESEALYETVVRYAVNSHVLDSLEKYLPQFQLDMIALNRPGTLVNDIKLGFSDGSERMLRQVEGDYVLIVFSNPDCKLCEELVGKIEASDLLTSLQAQGRLCKLSVYPGNDLSVWNPSKFPSGWIAGYDKEDRIWPDRLFSLKTMPALYLLDKDKKVLAKESSLDKVLQILSCPVQNSDCFH